jgi:hypothetical protein
LTSAHEVFRGNGLVFRLYPGQRSSAGLKSFMNGSLEADYRTLAEVVARSLRTWRDVGHVRVLLAEPRCVEKEAEYAACEVARALWLPDAARKAIPDKIIMPELSQDPEGFGTIGFGWVDLLGGPSRLCGQNEFELWLKGVTDGRPLKGTRCDFLLKRESRNLAYISFHAVTMHEPADLLEIAIPLAFALWREKLGY